MHMLICDDDARFAARVEQLVRACLGQREIPAEIVVCTSGEEALAVPDLELYQVALLDVDLDTMNGISLGRQLRERSPEICLIYISAYLEFAPEGYTVQAFRYILKRDLERMLPSCLEALFHEKIARSRKVLTIRQNRTSIELPYDSIYCLESDLRKVNVYGDVPHQPLCSYYGKLTDLPQALFENGFLRVGRSDVVNMRYIRQISGHMVCVSQWAAFLLVDRAYLGKGRVKHVGFWSVVLVAGMLAFSLIFQIGFFTLETVWYNVGYVLLSTLLFGGTLPQKLTAALINGTMCLLSENTVLYVVSWVTGTSLQVVWQRPGCLVTMTLTNLIVGVVVAYFSHQWKDERALESPQALVMSFFPGIVVVLNVVLMISVKDEPADSLIVLLTLGLTVAVLLHMYIVQMFNQQMARQQELHVQTALERERAEALMDSYTTQRRLTHEFTNHIEALTLLLQQGEYEEAKAYLATVTKIIAAHTTIMNTHNPLLDALLSKKYEEATCKGVMLYFDLPDLRAIPLEKTDLVMVVSNLLNNAIDAAAQADPPEVYFRMRKTEEELLLSVRNRVREDLNLPDGQLPRSTKKEPGHGIGLWNVTDVLRKYQGEYAISCRDKWFRFTCSVPVHRI